MIGYSSNYVRSRVGDANILNGGILPGILVAAIVPLAFAGVSLSILDITSIPLYAVFTLTRMTLAYLLSIGFALAYGITTGLSRRASRSEEHTSELQSRLHLVCRLLLEKKKNIPQ